MRTVAKDIGAKEHGVPTIQARSAMGRLIVLSQMARAAADAMLAVGAMDERRHDAFIQEVDSIAR